MTKIKISRKKITRDLLKQNGIKSRLLSVEEAGGEIILTFNVTPTDDEKKILKALMKDDPWDIIDVDEKK